MGFFDDWFRRRGPPDDAGKPNTSEAGSDAGDFNTEDISRDSIFDGWRIWISYADTEGKRSERWVRVYRVECRQFSDYLVGHCELRDETRTFRIDRIIDVADAGGEVHDPDEFFAPYIKRPPGRSAGPDRHTPFGRALHIIDRLGDELRLLAFVAEADGKMANKEANLIMRIAEMRASDLGIDLKKSEIVDLRRWMKSQRPDALTMQSALGRMARSKSGDYGEVWSLVEIIAEADGKIANQEIEALHKIKAAMDLEFAAAS